MHLMLVWMNNNSGSLANNLVRNKRYRTVYDVVVYIVVSEDICDMRFLTMFNFSFYLFWAFIYVNNVFYF